MIVELIKFLVYSVMLVVISKYILVKLLRNLAETLNLRSRTIGNISGVATSVPELLTISFSAATGLIGASVFNVISSNIINFIQYFFAVMLNKNVKYTNNKAIKIDIWLVIATIFIPIILVIINIGENITIIPIFILLFLLFEYINFNAHKLYLKKEEKILERKIEYEKKWLRWKFKKIIFYSVNLLLTTLLLFVIGNLLSDVLEELCEVFKISQNILGVFLGFVTSIPELITFLEAQKNNDNQLGIVESTNNLLTSNLLNLFIIQSIGILLYEILG